MLSITMEATELFNELTGEFVTLKPVTLKLEHSLISISKWEAKWHKPFSNSEKTAEEMRDYIRCMTLNGDIAPVYYAILTGDQIALINEYINNEMTATWFNSNKATKGAQVRGEIVTSELIYYWMITLNIPFECEKWHLNRLLTLIKVCNIKNSPKKKMSKKDIMARNRAINEANRRKYHSKG